MGLRFLTDYLNGNIVDKKTHDVRTIKIGKLYNLVITSRREHALVNEYNQQHS